MSTRHLNNLNDFRAVISKPNLTVVDFYASWCGPCKRIAPQIDELAQQKPDVNFVKVDVDQAREISQQYPVRAVPTILFFRNGSQVNKIEGADISRITSIVNSS